MSTTLTLQYTSVVTSTSLYKRTLSICSRSRRKMQNVANVSFLGMFVMYLLAALFGYLTFNGEQNTSSKRVTTPLIVQCQGELYSEAVFVLNGGVSVRAHRTGAISSQVLGKSPRQTLSRNRTSCLMFLRFPDRQESLCNAGVSPSQRREQKRFCGRVCLMCRTKLQRIC